MRRRSFECAAAHGTNNDSAANMTSNTSKRAIIAALHSDIAITLMKAGTAWFTGSSAMLSEAVHSLVDAGVALLLLYGFQRGAQPRDEFHPFGYSRELYFWSFIVALAVFALGAGVAVYGGVARVAALSFSSPQRFQRKRSTA